MIFDREDLLDFLSGLVDELEQRKETFRADGCSNIGQYNRRCLTMYERIIFACDEVAERLDKNVLGKDGKELVSKIENKLSVIFGKAAPFVFT